MPSIFNHENACWGVKRTSCDDVFQYNFNEEIELDSRKERGILDVGIVPKDNSDTSTCLGYKYPSIHYSVSSNCYYGYQPHGPTHKPIVDDEMEVEDSNLSEKNITDDSLTYDSESNLRTDTSENCNNFTRSSVDNSETTELFDRTFLSAHRKRHISMNDDPCTTKMRKEDSGGGETGLILQWRDLHDSIGVNENMTTELLRQTHGCEPYHYGREDDY